MIQRKILILGNEKSARYHPLSHVLFGIRQALKGCGAAAVNTEYKSMDISALQSYNCILSYIDDYQNLNGFDDVLAEYLEQGGRILALHNGIITEKDSRLEQAYGGNFVTHPPYCDLTFYVSDWADWISEKEFSMKEEPYIVRRTDDACRIFLRFAYQGKLYEAGWYREYQKGRMIYLSIGHDEKTAEKKSFQHLVRECILYLCEI